MKSEDITAIATTVIAVVVIVGGIFYFQKEGEKKRLRQERIEQMQLNMKKEKQRLLREQGDRERYKKYREDITKCNNEQFKSGKATDIGSPNLVYHACMTRKGYPRSKH